ncbi:hypothetical protein K7711_03070 [Nocardia sp. CA2R105]|uniref:hypothetical protein n=1 Tax=Nocardia coffeae TaxID=2873381 RepID=UPI001CA6DAC2|nr:hypothetical protein [Nocardia coffeae]MBY8855449.1 hypothetical protein [Nocardia coffeae]
MLSPDELRRFGADLARRLAAATGPHGGISPATVVFTTTGVEVNAAPTLAQSAGYVAPEVASGAPADAAADVFALGAVLVYAATGVGPFGTGAPVELLNRTLTSEPDLGAVPPQLRQMVADCLSRYPQQRPKAADLATRLALPFSPADPSAQTVVPHQNSAGQPPQSSVLRAEPTTPAAQSTGAPAKPAAPEAQFTVPPAQWVATPATPVTPPGHWGTAQAHAESPVNYAAPQVFPPERSRSPRRAVRIATSALFSVLILAAAVTFAVVCRRPADATDPAAASRAVIATDEVSALAVSPDGRRIYVGSWKHPVVSVIDTTSNTISRLIGVPQEPTGLAASADGAYLYVSSENAVSVIATASNTVIGAAIADAGSTPHGIAVSPDGTHLYTADGLRATVTVRDAGTRNATATIPIGAGDDMAVAVAATPDGRHLFATRAGEIAMIDTATSTVAARSAFDGIEGMVVAAPDGRSVYAVSQFSSTLHILDAVTGAETGTAKLPGMSTGLAVSPSGRYVFIANKAYSSDRTSGDIEVFDTASRTVVGGLQSGVGAGHLAITPNGHRLYASPLETDSTGVAVVDISRYS